MNRTPTIIGFLTAGALIIGTSMFVSSRSGSSYDDVPPVSILEPSSGDTVSNPVRIVFSTTSDLHLDPGMGWVAGDLHLHAMVGTRELMPAAADIGAEQVAGTFGWQLGALEPGSYTIHLTWAGRHHGNLRGVTDTIRIHVRD